MKRMIGLSLKLPYLNEDFFAKMKASGVEAVEISCATEDYDKLDYAAIKAAADKTGITLWSFHFPFGYYNIASLKPGRCEETVNYHSDLIRKASAIGIKRFVVHASGEPIAAEDRAECMRRVKKSLAALSQVAKECGAVIAVEDLPRTCLGNCHEDILELIGDDPTLGVCFDSNHLTLERGEDFLAVTGHRLITVHISDFDFFNERHWLPGEGKVDWPCMMQALDATGYDGVFLYELSFESTGTIERKRPLEPSDFAENAATLALGLAPKPVDVPYAKLGMWGRE